MDLTRRQFIGSTASAVALVLPLGLTRGEPQRDSAALPDREADRERDSGRCTLLDLGEGCALRESLAGYASALGISARRCTRADAPSIPRCALLIIPAALEISSSLARSIGSALQQGATVILESGAVFTPPASREFEAHRTALRERFGVNVGTPVSLWPRQAGAKGLPYVSYTWPIATHVRDFSKVLPVEATAPNDEIISTVDGRPVALRRRTGPGTLLFLGSPLGPALHAGDLEARSWLKSITAA